MSIASYAIIAIIIFFLILAWIRKLYLCYALLLTNFIIFFITTFYPPALKELAFNSSYLGSYKIYTIFTAMFLHLNFLHIILNMIGLVFIGLPFEYEIGSKKFAIIYFISGFSASIAFALVEKGYAVGASGAIFGLLGAFAFMEPFKKVVVPLFMPFIIFLRLPVLYVAIFYASIETIFAFTPYSTDAIAHSAHLGGFVAGVFLAVIMKKGVKAEEKRKEKIDLEALEKMISTEKQREILERIKNEEHEEIREAWISYLLQQIKCPKCGGSLEFNSKIVCKKCGYRK